MIALIDGDIVAYVNAASAENDPKEIALLRADKFLRDILETTKPILIGFFFPVLITLGMK
jgi:hypothetical protein